VGTGQGLAIAHSVVRKHGGRISVGTSTCADPFKQGDVDCNNLVNSIDALKIGSPS
jgi:hypothetical protein